jgi:hypothetical protein
MASACARQFLCAACAGAASAVFDDSAAVAISDAMGDLKTYRFFARN